MQKETVCRAAIYCRLSEEDRGKTEPAESESIQNQKSMLQCYAREQGWQVAGVYSDEDYTGADRSRPAFNRLLRDARSGCFEVVLCKSQSRFTRELELVEKYLHGLFPQWGIRFVGYADHADTENRGNKKARQINGLVNEWYLEDLSDNIRTVVHTKQRQGRYIGSFAPYGYRKSAADRNLLVPDPEAAAVVRHIYAEAAAGDTPGQIAAELNARSVQNPSAYKTAHCPGFRRAGQPSGLWSASSVRTLLQNPVYMGDLRQHIREKISYKSDKIRRVPAAEQILVPATHEPLVTADEWQKAQTLSKPVRAGRVDGLRALCRCGVCGRPLKVHYSHGRPYYCCPACGVSVRRDRVQAYFENGKTAGANRKREQELRRALLDEFAENCARVVRGDWTLQQFENSRKSWQKRYSGLSAESPESVPAPLDKILLVFPRGAQYKEELCWRRQPAEDAGGE